MKRSRHSHPIIAQREQEIIFDAQRDNSGEAIPTDKFLQILRSAMKHKFNRKSAIPRRRDKFQNLKLKYPTLSSAPLTRLE